MATGTVCNIFLGNHKSSTVSRVGGKCACNIFTASCVRLMLLLCSLGSYILVALNPTTDLQRRFYIHAIFIYIERLIRFKRNSQQTKPLFKFALFLPLPLDLAPWSFWSWIPHENIEIDFVVHASMTRVIFNSVIGSLAFYTFFSLASSSSRRVCISPLCVWFVAKTNLCNQQNVDDEREREKNCVVTTTTNDFIRSLHTEWNWVSCSHIWSTFPARNCI